MKIKQITAPLNSILHDGIPFFSFLFRIKNTFYYFYNRNIACRQSAQYPAPSIQGRGKRHHGRPKIASSTFWRCAGECLWRLNRMIIALPHRHRHHWHCRHQQHQLHCHHQRHINRLHEMQPHAKTESNKWMSTIHRHAHKWKVLTVFTALVCRT